MPTQGLNQVASVTDEAANHYTINSSWIWLITYKGGMDGVQLKNAKFLHPSTPNVSHCLSY